MSTRPDLPRTVKPRKPTRVHLPVIAVDDKHIYLERTGEIRPVSRLSYTVLKEKSSLWVCASSVRLLKQIDDEIDHPLWQFRVSPVTKEVWSPNRERKVHTRDTRVAFFGLRAPARNRQSKWHYPIDPTSLVNKTIHEIIGGKRATLDKLIEWGLCIRDFLLEQGMSPKSTSGGIGIHFLKDPRFYPEPRRKIPKATNESARERLPGNYYALHCPTEKPYPATYYDQLSAHHSCAKDIVFPRSDHLRGYGYFRNEDTRLFRTGGDFLEGKSGLFHLAVAVPHFPRNTILPPYIPTDQGRHTVYVFSNEVPFLLALGVRIEGVIAAWASHTPDTGLNTYAKWSLDRLANAPISELGWLKPTLLSTYGVLAGKPRCIEFGYKQAIGPTASYPAGSGRLTVHIRRTTKEIELPTVNVIHRGMIEAETRLRSVKFARDLQRDGFRILGIYADSVFIENAGVPLPFPPDGWTVKGHLDGLIFHSSTAFSSRTLTKLPGIPQEARLRVQRRQVWRALTRARNSRKKEMAQ